MNNDVYVEVMGCYEKDSCILWAEPASAEFFGIYVGRPGDFVWEQDVDTREEAMKRAHAIAESRGIPPENVYLVGAK